MKLVTFICLSMFCLSVNAAGKFAFINANKVFLEAPAAIEASKKLEKQFGAREKALRKSAKGLQKLEQDYKKDNAIMSAAQKKKSEAKIIKAGRKFQADQISLKRDLQASRQKLMLKVRQSISKVIQAYGKKKGYDFIFTDASMVYANEGTNITEEILKQLKK